MVAQININPILTTNAPNTFAITLDGFMQGMAMDDPASRYWLTGGTVDPTETTPIWGGVPIQEVLAVGEPAVRPIIKHAVDATHCTGISVFNQDHSMISTPQSNVPVALPGMTAHCYRFGSNARIPMMMDPALAAALPGLVISPSALYWDPTNQYVTLTTTGGTWALPTSLKVVGWNAGSSMTVSYNSGTGFANWVRNGNCVLVQI
jgi:hypothetical protein